MSLLRVLLRRDTAAPDPFRALPQSPPRGLRARIHPSGCAIRATRVNHRWQVFGLVGSRFSPPLLTAASQDEFPVLVAAFVPTYRCGAVPDRSEERRVGKGGGSRRWQ